MTSKKLSLRTARRRDQEDPLRSYRDQFYGSDEKLIYLDGNSLGRLPEKTRALLRQEVDHAWGNRLIRSWNESWMDLPMKLATKLARLIGAGSNELLFCDATSINLYKLAHAALLAQSPRQEIITDALNFPSDQYILQGVLDQFPEAPPLNVLGKPDDLEGPIQQIKDQLSDKTALLSLSLVTYKSAYLYPLKALTEAAHAVGALVLWDLSHAAGAVDIDLQAAGVDLAVGCSYKYLNGGPGAPAYLFVREDLQSRLHSPITGWFGDSRPFEFESTYHPQNDIRRFAVGTPPVLSMVAIEPGLDMMLEAGISGIRRKSLDLQDFLLELYEEHLTSLDFRLGSPREAAHRGSHISLQHVEAARICKALISPPKDRPAVIPDFRAPQSIRLGLTPLYTSFEDVWHAVDRLVEIIKNEEFQNFEYQSEGVT